MQSTPPCPNTGTVRRNPPRKARATPSTSTRLPILCPLSTASPSCNTVPQEIPSFPIEDILSIEVPQNHKTKQPLSENLKVFLRIRPLIVHESSNNHGKSGAQTKNAWPRKLTTKNESKPKSKKKSVICVSVNDSNSVTLCPPMALQEVKRLKSEIYEGFSHVFPADSSQGEVFEKMVKPLVDEFLTGRSGMLAALGPSGSGKTHTVFGSPREPGMVPLALGRIFSSDEMVKSQLPRTFYLSMFEICSERGKSERLCDLLQDGGDLCMQQSNIRGLQEVLISDVQQAESFIARGMLKRATATTNSNSQSSRSQCVINIRAGDNKIDKEVDVQFNCAVLTIVDLAGAEREKRTGNQGARLLESNFINNTSMVFGLCLRSLLEHQKNPKKPLHKHFQGSLLTRYLRDYLEGKKRMALILTVKSGEEDYLDSSFLLRQASPYMKIKFDNVEEPVYLHCTKRNNQMLPRKGPLKRMKFSSPEAYANNRAKGAGDQLHEEEGQKTKEIAPQNTFDHLERTINWGISKGISLEESCSGCGMKERNHKIMQNFAKALWNVLKQYKMNLEVAENQIHNLKDNLADEMARRSKLEKELEDLKAYLSCQKEISPVKKDSFSANKSVVQELCQPIDVHELNAEIPSLRPDESECTVSKQRSDINENNFDSSNVSCVAVDDSKRKGQGDQCNNEECGGFPVNVESAEDLTELKDKDKESRHPLLIVSPPRVLSLTKGNSCYLIEENKLHGEEDKVAEHQIQNDQNLGESHTDEMARHSESEIELKDLQAHISCQIAISPVKEVGFSANRSAAQERSQPTDVHGLDPGVSSLSLDESECIVNKQRSDSIANDFVSSSTSCLAIADSERQGQGHECTDQNREGFPVNVESAEDLTDLKDMMKDSRHRQSIGSSPKTLSLTNVNACYSEEENILHGEEDEEQLYQPIMPQEEVGPGCKVNDASKSEPELESCSKPLKAEKPKRRLVPASSILLKDVGGLNFGDENKKPKGTKGDKKWAPNERNRTQGSISLLRLLKSNLQI